MLNFFRVFGIFQTDSGGGVGCWTLLSDVHRLNLVQLHEQTLTFCVFFALMVQQWSNSDCSPVGENVYFQFAPVSAIVFLSILTQSNRVSETESQDYTYRHYIYKIVRLAEYLQRAELRQIISWHRQTQTHSSIH